MKLRDKILSAKDRDSVPVEVPEWGVTVNIAAMSSAERDSWEKDMIQDREKNIRARLCVRVMLDDDGERIFKDEDAEELGKKAASALDRIFAEAIKLNGLSSDDVEELAKNS